jgi:fermentation-respiration switch protein FrsA (DUF1100 family)
MGIFLVCVSLYIALTAFVYVMQRKLQYFPNSTEVKAEEAGLTGVERLILPTPDGEKILVWYKAAPPGRPTILYFHGNGGGISGRADKLQFYAQSGFGFLAVSYRGYEGSSGSPSEAGFVTDAATAYNWLNTNGVKADSIFLVGESIGSGVAVQLAAQKPIRAMALEAPYANAVDVGAKIYWYLPVRFLMKDQFRSVEYIADVHAPLLIIHGNADRLIPFSQGQKLFQLANEPKQFEAVNHVGHEVIFQPATWAREVEFFEKQHAIGTAVVP